MDNKINLVPKILQHRITEEQWRQERSLYLSGRGLSPEGAKALAKWKGTIINLSSQGGLQNESIKALAKWSGTYLDLSFNYIGPEGAKYLAKWPGIYLNLHGNEIGPESVRFLTQWTGKYLCLSSNIISHEDAENLTQKIKERYITTLIHIIGNYFIKDIQTYVLGKLLIE